MRNLADACVVVCFVVACLWVVYRLVRFLYLYFTGGRV